MKILKSAYPFIDIHTHKDVPDTDILYVKNIFPNYTIPNTPFSVGQHPWHANNIKEDKLIEILTNTVENKQCYAIGEVGLDKLCDTPYNIQQTIFELQVNFAITAKLPVIVHNVKSTQEILNIIKGKETTFIFHGFTGNYKTMSQILDKGCYISFGHTLIHNTSTKESLTKISSKSLFLETDESELSIQDIYNQAANIAKMDVETLKVDIYSNFSEIFNHKKR